MILLCMKIIHKGGEYAAVYDGDQINAKNIVYFLLKTLYIEECFNWRCIVEGK